MKFRFSYTLISFALMGGWMPLTHSAINKCLLTHIDGGSRESLTSTRLEDGSLVPWIAKKGPFHFTPETPPKSIHELDYSKIMPEAFSEYGPGGPYPLGGTKHKTLLALDFWEQAIEGEGSSEQIERVFLKNGRRTKDRFEAPMAVYKLKYGSKDWVIFIQQGNHQILGPSEVANQLELERGYVRLFRGIGHRSRFVKFNLPGTEGSQRKSALIQTYYDLLYESFSDSSLSFRTSNMSANHEVKHIVPRGYLHLPMVTAENSKIPKKYLPHLLAIDREHYTFSKAIAGQKFGPNYVEFRTPLTNLRITGEFAGEWETRIIDPTLVEVVGTHGSTSMKIVEEQIQFSYGGQKILTPLAESFDEIRIEVQGD